MDRPVDAHGRFSSFAVQVLDAGALDERHQVVAAVAALHTCAKLHSAQDVARRAVGRVCCFGHFVFATYTTWFSRDARGHSSRGEPPLESSELLCVSADGGDFLAFAIQDGHLSANCQIALHRFIVQGFSWFVRWTCYDPMTDCLSCWRRLNLKFSVRWPTSQPPPVCLGYNRSCLWFAISRFEVCCRRRGVGIFT